MASPFRRHLVAAPADPKLPAGVALPAYMQWWQTWTLQTLRHLQTLINVASKADDPDVAYRILREMIGVIKNVEPPKPRPDQHAFKRPSHLRSVK